MLEEQKEMTLEEALQVMVNFKEKLYATIPNIYNPNKDEVVVEEDIEPWLK